MLFRSEDGSAYFEVPAMKEIYLQLVDGDGRELLRMTSALNVMPGESRSCAGCHESRMTASGSFTGRASRRPPTPLAPPNGLRAGVIDYMRDIQPIWNGHCVRCHGGADPAGGLSLEDGRTRFFCRSYDGLNERARSDRTSYLSYGGAPGAGKRKPLIHSIQARILERVAISFSSGPRFVRALHYDLSWMALHSMARNFTELLMQALLPQQGCVPIDFELWCWRRPLRVPWTPRRSNQSILKETNPEYSLDD